jgi:hypothetical protein
MGYKCQVARGVGCMHVPCQAGHATRRVSSAIVWLWCFRRSVTPWWTDCWPPLQPCMRVRHATGRARPHKARWAGRMVGLELCTQAWTHAQSRAHASTVKSTCQHRRITDDSTNIMYAWQHAHGQHIKKCMPAQSSKPLAHARIISTPMQDVTTSSLCGPCMPAGPSPARAAAGVAAEG